MSQQKKQQPVERKVNASFQYNPKDGVMSVVITGVPPNKEGGPGYGAIAVADALLGFCHQGLNMPKSLNLPECIGILKRDLGMDMGGGAVVKSEQHELPDSEKEMLRRSAEAAVRNSGFRPEGQ